MVQIVRRKRKGRPSNRDRSGRHSSAAPPSPVERRRSRRRRNVRYNFDIDDYVDDDEFYDDEDEEVGRREKKLRLLLCEDDSRSNRRVTHAPASSSSDEYDEDDDGKPSKKRKVVGDSDEDNEIEEIRGRIMEEEEDGEEEEEDEEKEEVAGGSDSICGTASDLPKGIPLPDKKTLELILDKLQKKDIYGVYAEPVDPEELPDYHDVIKHPMDFATVRKKLSKGSYLTLKEFESDVLLICTNAMQYNAPDTIYYKQASSIQEQAKLRFQRLRANVGQTEIELKAEQKPTPSFSLPKSQLKKLVAQTAQDPVGSETISGSMVRTGEFPNGSSAQTPVRPNSGEVLTAENSSLADNNLDKDQELLPGKGFISKLGRKPSIHDENRRATYNISVQPVTESDSIFSTFEGESKQFIPVGLHVDHSYARSLARFAATLGSVAWKVASQTIEQALPEGVKFGRGWVGEYESLSTPVLTPKNCTLKEPHFLTHFKIPSNVKDDEKAFKFTVPVDSPESALFGNRIPVKQESHGEAIKEPRPPFISSLQVNPAFSGSNHLHRNTPSRNFTKPENEGSPEVELNHPPAIKPVSGNRNLASVPCFKLPNGNNGGFVSRRPSKGQPAPVNLDSNRMVPTDKNLPYPTTVSQDCNRLVPADYNSPHRQEQQGLSDPVQMMKVLAEKTQNQQKTSNGLGFGFGFKREDSNNAASTIPQFPSTGSGNVALTAAQAWMSLGGSRGFIKPPLTENTNPHKISTDSSYNPTLVRQQQFPVPGIHYQQPFHAVVPQPSRMIDEARLQNLPAGYPQLVTTDLSRFQMQQQSRPKQQESRPPDLNIGYQSMGSPARQSTGMMVDSQQPDLALQL